MANWTVYLLYNTANDRTYIGCTNNIDRRLRQHNRELKGGANSTYSGRGHWVLAAALFGFVNRSEALRWEKILKSRCRGLKGRLEGFRLVRDGECPVSNKLTNIYEPPKGLTYAELD